MRRRIEIYKVARQQFSIWGTVNQRGENRWTNGCLHPQQEVLSDAASAPHPVLVGCQAVLLLSHSPLMSVSTQRTVSDWVKSWDYKIPVNRDVSRDARSFPRLTTSGLSAQVGVSEVHSDKSHGKLDSQTLVKKVLIGQSGWACPLTTTFHSCCCLHLTHDSSLLPIANAMSEHSVTEILVK